MSKTTQFLKILHQLSHSSTRCLSEVRIRELLDNPPRSTWHRLINELTQGCGEVPALLMETDNTDDGQRYYCINHRGWQAFMDAHTEGKFLLECYRQIGHLLDSDFTNMVFEIPDLDRKQVNSLERKFLHLVKVKAHESKRSKIVLNTIIEGLIGNRQLELTYDGGIRTVRPLTLCQHRDELYLMCYRTKDAGLLEKRTYKISRISGVRLLERKFPYPPKQEWDPVNEYQNSSGLVLGEVKKVRIRVWGNSRKILQEKEFFNAEFLNRDDECDTYQCSYTNHHEFLGQIFVYAQDIEIVDDEFLREQFILKAQEGVLRNSGQKKRIG